MGVDHRRSNVGMAEQLLDGSYICTALEHVRGKAMAKCVRRYLAMDSRFLDSIGQCLRK